MVPYGSLPTWEKQLMMWKKTDATELGTLCITIVKFKTCLYYLHIISRGTGYLHFMWLNGLQIFKSSPKHERYYLQ